MLSVLLVAVLSACGEKAASAPQEIVTQKVIGEGRTPISVLVKYAFTINGFEQAVEEKFPAIDLVQVGNHTGDMGVAEYEQRLANDDLPDIVMTWPLNVGEEYWADRLMDLSSLPFTTSYNLGMLNSISRDGALYYLPGPAQVRGIVYNKTLFEENGWQVPTDFEGFLALCRSIEGSGIRSIQLPFGNSEVLDTAFVGYGFADCYSKPQDSQWIIDYSEGIGSFGDHFGPALDTFQRMIDEGIWRPEDLNVTYAERETMLFARQCAMVEDSVLIARMGKGLTGSTDEFALMPFFNPDGTDWARLYMVCYIGLNKHLEEPEYQAKYDLVMQLMDYISTPEGQEALAMDTGAMYSSVNGVPAPDAPEVADLTAALEHGRYAIFPQLKNVQPVLREGLAGMLRGAMTKQDVIELVDKRNLSGVQVRLPVRLGAAAEDFTLIETGNFVTDAMRAESGCDVALFLDNGKDGRYNGKGISARLYGGDITVQDVDRILPDLKQGEEGVLWKVTMTGADLISTLEHAIPVGNNNTGWFYYFSGLRVEFNPTAIPGERIRTITLEDGGAVEPETIYSIAVMDDSTPEEFFKSCEETDVTIADIVTRAIEGAEHISPSGDGRFTIVS